MLDPADQFESDEANDDPTVALTPAQEEELAQRLAALAREERVRRAMIDAGREVAGDPDDVFRMEAEEG